MHLFRPLSAGGLFAALCVLAACAGHPGKPGPGVQTAPPPPLTAPYAAAARAGKAIYRLDAAKSDVKVLVDKAGPLSGVGHRHVITVGGLRGFARIDENGNGQADLRFPVNALDVDPAAAKKIYPRYSMPSKEDVAGTREHMLGPVLESSRYPWVTLHVEGTIETPSPGLSATITLHGVRRKIKITGDFVRQGNELTVQGDFPIKQSEFGIVPYSVMMGALRVKDAIRIRYHIRFSAWCGAAISSKVPTC